VKFRGFQINNLTHFFDKDDIFGFDFGDSEKFDFVFFLRLKNFFFVELNIVNGETRWKIC